MRLEDALLCVMVDAAGVSPAEGMEICRGLIAGGADLVRVRGPVAARDTVAGMGRVCREDDALFVLDDDPVMAAELGADGVHLDGSGAEVAYARSVVGMDRLVGMSSRGYDEAVLALSIGADYLVHHGGAECPAVFAGLRGLTAVPLFAAEIRDLREAEAIVRGGVYRLCLAWDAKGAAEPRGQMAGYSTLLGRSM